MFVYTIALLLTEASSSTLAHSAESSWEPVALVSGELEQFVMLSESAFA